MNEYVACVRTKRGTETVTIKANSGAHARYKLLRLGYLGVIYIC